MSKAVDLTLFYFTAIFLFSFLLISCNQSERHDQTSDRNPDASQNQIDINLPTMYTGELPCADCPGINYRLIIEENRFTEVSIYQDRSPGRFEKTGRWIVEDDTLSLIDSEDSTLKRFLVNKQTLTLLDQNNQQISGELSERYKLNRTANQPSIRSHHQRLAEQGYRFFAGGNEPFWSVKLDSSGSLIYETPECTQTFGNADSSFVRNTVTFTAQTDSSEITLQTTNTYCQDSMSGYLFPREVTLIIHSGERDTLSGCGLFLNS